MPDIRIGARVEAVRVTGETRQGYVLARVESLSHIGTFYLVGDAPAAPETAPVKGRPRKGAERRPRVEYHEWGMYAPEQLRVIRGRPRTL